MQYKKLFIPLLIQLLCTFNAKTQKLDSLLNELGNHKQEDTVRLNLLNAIASKYININPDEGLKMSDAAITLSQKLNRPISLAYAYTNKAGNYMIKSDFSHAIELYQKSIAIAEQTGNKTAIAWCYFGMGTALYFTGNITQGLEYLQKDLAIYEEQADKEHIARTLGNIGNIYKAIPDYEKAMEYYERALAINQQLINKNEIAINTGNMGLVYEAQENYSKALECYLKAVDIFSITGHKIGLANNLCNIGNIYDHLADYKKAIEYDEKSLSLLEQIGNKQGTAYVLGNLGACYQHLSEYPKALEYYQRTLGPLLELGDTAAIAKSYVNLGNIYSAVADYDKALQYFESALSLDKKTDNEYGIATDLANIGITYFSLSQGSKALNYFQQALQIKNKLGIEDAFDLKSIGEIYSTLKQYEKSVDYLQKSLIISEKSGDKKITAANFLQIGIVYGDIPDSLLFKIGSSFGDRYAKAMTYFKKSLKIAEENKILEVQSDVWKNLSILYEKQKDYVASLEAYKNFINLRDSVINDKKKKEITRLEIQYDYNKKEDSLKMQQKLTGEKLNQQLLLAKQQQQQLALNQNKLTLTNKEKDLQKIAYLKTQAELQNEQLQKKGKEKQLTISEKEKQLQQANIKTLTQEKNLNAFRQQQQWIYIIGGLILIGFISSWFFYRTRLQQVRLKTQIAAERIEQQQKETEFQQKLGDISLSALRSQMNPHFIFNCLNSIKLYTTQNDTVAASEYLTKFSRLIRLVLENSRNDRITLASELDALRLYMEMEAMRFKEKLKYNIEVEQNVDLDYIEIPPLLLQPYVENAIWHGLMQKEEGGRIDINIGIEDNESMLAINITDNGIGRARATQLKSKTATRHKSYGMKVTSERLALINQIYKSGANVTIYDLIDINGQPSGTQVTIKIPIE